MFSRNDNTAIPVQNIQFPCFYYCKVDNTECFYAHMSVTEVLCIDLPTDGSLPRIAQSCIPDLWKYNAASCLKSDYASFCNARLLADQAISKFLTPAHPVKEEIPADAFEDMIDHPAPEEYSDMQYSNDLEAFVDNQGAAIDWSSQPDKQPMVEYEEPLEEYIELQFFPDTRQISSPVKQRA